MSNVRRRVLVLAGLAIGGLFLWLAVREIELEGLVSALTAANLAYTLPFILFLGIFYWLKAVRWALLLKPSHPFTTRQLVGSMMIGFAGNNVLPVRLGELLRVYLLGKEFGLSKTLVLATLVLERVFDAITILILITLAIFASDILSENLSTARLLLGFATIAAILSIVMTVYPPRFLSRLLQWIGTHLPASVASAGLEKIRFVQKGFDSVRSLRAIAWISINSLCQWLALSLCIQVSIVALGVDVPAVASIVVLALIVAGISIPGAPGFVGTIELCFVVGLGLFSVAPTDALAVAIFYHSLTFIAVTAAGAVYFPRYRRLLTGFNSETQPIKKSGDD